MVQAEFCKRAPFCTFAATHDWYTELVPCSTTQGQPSTSGDWNSVLITGLDIWHTLTILRRCKFPRFRYHFCHFILWLYFYITKHNDKFPRIKFNARNSINRSHFNSFFPIASMPIGAAVVKFIVNIVGIFKAFNAFCH